MKIFRNINQLLTLAGVHQKEGRHPKEDDLSILEDSYLIIDDNKIIDFGLEKNLKNIFQKDLIEIDASKMVILPPITDCHTHTVFAGNRAKEHAMRLAGKTYQEIAQSGGGINYTAEQTRNASEKMLFQDTCNRIEIMKNFGITGIEIKSGYGLDIKNEEKISRIISSLKSKISNIKICNTFMAAHAVPKEYSSSADFMAKVAIPALHSISTKYTLDAVDIFHEENYFSGQDIQLLFDESKKRNIPFKIHADEFNNNNGAAFALTHNALSADHLLCTPDEVIKKFSTSKTIATILPGTAFFLGKKPANARAFFDTGARVALATDYNPGSSHINNLILLSSMSASMLKLSLAETISAITYNAASACGWKNHGHIEKSCYSGISVFECDDYQEIFYSWGQNLNINKRLLGKPVI